MTTLIDETGAQIDTWSQARQTIATAFRSLFGDQWKVDDEDAIVGKVVTILTDMTDKLNERVQYAVSQYNPDDAYGTGQSKLVKLNGITRNEGLYSTVPITATANAAGTKIYAGDKVSDPDNQAVTWSLDSGVTLAPYGSTTLSATCDVIGKNEADPGTLTFIVTPRPGWSSATNNTKASPGQSEEQDTRLRTRRDRTARSWGKTTIDGVWSALADLDSVEEVFVHQNLTLGVDEYGVPGRSMWAIIAGASDDDIAEVLFKVAPLRTHGSSSATYDYRGHTYTEYFSRPTDTEIDVDITLKPISTSAPADYPDDGDDRIKAALEAFSDAQQTIGVDAIPSQIAAAALTHIDTKETVISGYYVDECLVDSGSSVVSADLDERLVILGDNVTVTVAS